MNGRKSVFLERLNYPLPKLRAEQWKNDRPAAVRPVDPAAAAQLWVSWPAAGGGGHRLHPRLRGRLHSRALCSCLRHM